MGDGLKLSKEKRHRSSSSITGAAVKGARSDRKLDLTDSIVEVEDQFALAEARCENLQEKIDLVKVVKRKNKLKKLSMTRVNEQSVPPENMSFITVRTQPKKKAVQAARLRRLEAPNPVRGYVDPVHEEQHRMLGQIRGYDQACEHPHQEYKEIPQHIEQKLSKTRVRRARAGGDRVMYGRSVQISGPDINSIGNPKGQDGFSDYEDYDRRPSNYFGSAKNKSADVRQLSPKIPAARRRHVPRDIPAKPGASSFVGDMGCERRVVELFNNNKKTNVTTTSVPTQQPVILERKQKKEVRDALRRGVRPSRDKFNDQSTGPLGEVSSPPPVIKKEHRRKTKYRCRRYELPTMASQMKQAGMRYYQGNGYYPNIPFVVSKSTGPSHNIGVNIQQVLNGLKVQQPLTGIPPTIAHHMGLRHVSSYMAKNNLPPVMSEHREINTIKLGRRLVRLPSSKYISYNRVLNMYREGEGMVPRFLRAISRPHYFYTSMYNLATTREDLDGATSKGNGIAAQEVKQSLAEYASLYREYEQLDKALREGNYDPEWERRCDEISKELATREERVRKMVQDYKGSDAELAPLRASASTAEETCRRRSSFKLGD